MFPALKASESAVVVSTVPVESTIPATRLTDADVADVTIAPVAASYPDTTRYFPSAERAINPSVLEDPLATSRLFEPLTLVGMAIV
jgi:hypothetical protein